MKTYILVLILNFISFGIFAENTSFTGVVKLKNGNPVADATVVIKGLDKHSLTDQDGKFTFSGVDYGKYEVEVISVEIQNTVFHIDFNTKYSPKVLEVNQSDVSLKEVVVNAKTQKKEIETKGFAVNVIETQKFTLQSVQTNELLGRAAGVIVLQDAGLGSKVKYNINGLSGDAVKIFIDGMPASNFGGSFSLNSIPPALIERIEVYKGVVPGYLLDDALGGAINVVLKQRRNKSLSTSYSVGSFNTHQWNMTGSNRWKNGFTVDGSAFLNYSDNDYEVWGEDVKFKDYEGVMTSGRAKRFHDAYKSMGARFNVGFTDVKWADQFLVGGIISKDYKEIQTGTTMTKVYGNRHSRQKSGVLTLLYDKKDLFTKGLSLKVDFSHSYLNRQLIDTIGIQYAWNGPIIGPDGEYVMTNSGSEVGDSKSLLVDREYTNVVRSNLTYKINDNHSFYVNHLFNDFERKSTDECLPLARRMLINTRDLQKNILAFTYENIAFSDKLRTNLFFKYYQQKTTSKEPELLNAETQEYKINKTQSSKNETGYGLTVSYALLPNLYILGSGENAIRMPNAQEIFGVATEETLTPTSPLKPEKSINFNLGINFGPYVVRHHVFSFNTSIYYRDTKDKIIKLPDSKGKDVSRFVNADAVETTGIDAELNYSYKECLDIRFGISKFNILYNTKYDENGKKYNQYREQMPNEPSLKFNGSINYSINHIFLKKSRTSIRYNISYIDSYRKYWYGTGTANLAHTPTQLVMDLGLTYIFPKRKVSVSFDAKNLLDRQVYDNYAMQKPGRAFYGKITYFIF